MKPSAQESKSTPQFGRTFDTVVLTILIVAMCSQLNLRAIGRDTFVTEKFVTKQLFVALSDVVLLLGFAWFCVRTTILRVWNKIWIPPLPCWALVFAMLLSVIHSTSIWDAAMNELPRAQGIKGTIKAIFLGKESKEAIAEILQYIAYFLAATTLFVNLIHDRRESETIERRKLAFHAFAGAVALNIVIALIQRFGFGSQSPYGLFGSSGIYSPNIYSAFLAFSLPLLLAQVLSRWRDVMPALIVTCLCFAGALLTMTSAWAAISLLLGLFVAAALQRRMARAAILFGVVALPMLLLWRAPSPLQINRAQSWQIPSDQQKVKKQLVEWYAALGVASPSPIAYKTGVSRTFATGVGPGNYQSNIGTFYQRLPNEKKMPPDSNNLYLVQAVSLGILGLGTLLWMFGHFGAMAWNAFKENRNDYLGAGVWASLCALALVNIFHATIVRGSGIVLAFLLSLAVVAAGIVPKVVEIKENQNEEDEKRDGADLPAGA